MSGSHDRTKKTRKTVKERATADKPCPICLGDPHLDHGVGERSTGYLSADGRVRFCTREQWGGKLAPVPTAAGPAWPHKIISKCPCGTQHGVRPPTPTEDADEPEGCTLAAFAEYAQFTEEDLREHRVADGKVG